MDEVTVSVLQCVRPRTAPGQTQDPPKPHEVKRDFGVNNPAVSLSVTFIIHARLSSEHTIRAAITD